MRLLFLSTVYPTPWEPHKGPANRSTVESLRALGCTVEVVAPVPWTRRLRSAVSDVPPARHPTYWYPPWVARRFYHQFMWQSTRRTLTEVARQFEPQAVLAFWTDPEGSVAVRLGRALGIPSGIIAGGSDLLVLPESPSRARIIGRALQQTDHVFAVGSQLVRRSVELGAAPERVSNFLCGVDLTRFGPGDRDAARARLGLPLDGPLLLWIGQMLPVKAADRLLEALPLVLASHPNLRLALVGDGDERAALTALVERTPALQGRVLFPGAVTHEVLPAWYQAADLFVLPSRSEGMPNVLLEALASGLPFVASDVGSIRDLLPFGPSAVVPSGNIPALAAAIDAALRDTTPRPLPAVRWDRLDGARHLLTHLGLTR